jgi:hypothetical protein
MSMARRVGEIVRAPTAEPLRVPESVEYAFWAWRRSLPPPVGVGEFSLDVGALVR